MMGEYQQSLMRYPHTNNSLLSSGNTKKSTTYEPRTEAISPAINDDIISAEDSTSKSTKDEQTLLVEKLKKVEAEILQTDLQIVRLRRQKEQLEQAASSHNKDEDDQENVCDTKQLSIAKLVYHENRAKAQKSHSKLEGTGGPTRDLPIYNQPSDNSIYHQISAKYNHVFKPNLINCFKNRLSNRLNLEETISKEYDQRMEKWLKGIEAEDSQPTKRLKDAKTREFFEKQFPELKKARESGERFSRVGQRVARSDAEVAELLDGITEREDQDKKVKSYAVIPPMLEEMRSSKPKYLNKNGYVEDIIAEYKEYQLLNTWTDEEKEIFRENYLQHPKDFGLIARMTTRKNVANCVQYYYLSKKSENYKQLLKRQQKRRTRSFVRPAQATPAHPNPAEVDAGKANSPSNNDKQAGDNVALDVAKSAEQLGSSKPGAFLDQLNNGGTDPNQGTELTIDNSCCICSCRFDDTNTYRNVTRSNHQLYGISRDTLKPGMKICFPCRFRHVKHPSFDEPYTSPEPMDEDQEDLHPTDMMDVDKPVIEEHQKPFSGAQVTNNEINIPATRTISPPKEQQQSDLLPSPNSGDQNKGPKRTCVRDIIYQAIEMSFQKPKTTEPMDVQPKLEPIRSDAVATQSLPPTMIHPHNLPPSNILPLKQIGPNHVIPNSLAPPPPPPHVPMQNLTMDQQDQLRLHKQYMEYNYRQQLQAQQMQQQRHMRHQKPQQLHQPPNQPPLLSTQLPPPMMARYPAQTMPINPMMNQQPLRHMTPQSSHPMPPLPTSNHNLLTTTVPISSPMLHPAVSHQSGHKSLPPPPPPPVITQLPGPTNAATHPLDFSKKYSEQVYAPNAAKPPHPKNRPPPMAHSGKSSQSSRGGSVDEGVLNLSAKSQSPATTPLPQPNMQSAATNYSLQPTMNSTIPSAAPPIHITQPIQAKRSKSPAPPPSNSRLPQLTSSAYPMLPQPLAPPSLPPMSTQATPPAPKKDAPPPPPQPVVAQPVTAPVVVEVPKEPSLPVVKVEVAVAEPIKAVSPDLQKDDKSYGGGKENEVEKPAPQLPEVAPISPPTVKVSSPKQEATTKPSSPSPPKSPLPPKSPPRQADRDDSRSSPGFTNSPTSPSEMVIDESADVGSPSSASSPASDHEEEKAK